MSAALSEGSEPDRIWEVVVGMGDDGSQRRSEDEELVGE